MLNKQLIFIKATMIVSFDDEAVNHLEKEHFTIGWNENYRMFAYGSQTLIRWFYVDKIDYSYPFYITYLI